MSANEAFEDWFFDKATIGNVGYTFRDQMQFAYEAGHKGGHLKGYNSGHDAGVEAGQRQGMERAAESIHEQAREVVLDKATVMWLSSTLTKEITP